MPRPVRADGEGPATVTLTPAEAGDQVAQDRIRRAEITSDGRRFGITLPSLASTGSHNTVSHSGGGIHVSQTIRGGVVTGNVVGVQISGNGNVVISGTGGGGVIVTVHAPTGSSLTADSTGGTIRQYGTASRVHANTSGGDITIGTAECPARARTSGGDIHADDLRQGGSLRTSGGSISARLTGNYPLTARTSGGDLHLSTADGIDEHHVSARVTGGIVRLNGTTVSR